MKNHTVVCFGELLLRLDTGVQRFSQAQQFQAGYVGSEANVAVLLSRLGIHTRLASVLPANELGSAARDQVRQHGIDTSSILFREGRIGVFFSESAASLRPGHIIYDRAHSAFAELKPGEIDWKTVFKGAEWFHWSGISPAVSHNVALVCREALQEARQSGLKISADFNYRSKMWKYGKHPAEVMPELLSYCDVIYGDIDTATIYFDINTNPALSRDEALLSCGEALKKRLPHVKSLAMTFREQLPAGSQAYSGVLLHDKLYHSRVFELGTIVERIGTGDAFMGGLIYALLHEEEPQHAINFAVAAGALKHAIAGDAALTSRDEIESLLKTGSTFGRIIR